MVLRVVGCVIEGLVLGYVLVHILGIDLKEKAVSVSVEELQLSPYCALSWF